jgi:hyperosmotically inducible periplasmic protein
VIFTINRGIGVILAVTIAAVTVAVPEASFAQTASTTNDAKTQRQANRKLARDVRRAFDKAQLDADDVRILAKGGVVTLAGTVPDGADISRLPTVAAKVPGVTSVANDVGVREEGH